MPPVEFEPTIPARERPQTHALDRAATRTGSNTYSQENIREPITKTLQDSSTKPSVALLCVTG
jgi:hypothetical protein